MSRYPEIRHSLKRALEDDWAARRQAFRALVSRLRQRTADLPQTPSEVLIREDRQKGHEPG